MIQYIGGGGTPSNKLQDIVFDVKKNGDYAKEQGDHAKEVAENIEEAAENASEAVKKANEAIEYANNAATNANKAANNADEKANLAQEKAKLAQEKIDSLDTLKAQINQAITDSQNATTNANKATSNANDKATYAQQQGDYAKAQGDYAKQQGDAVQRLLDNGPVVSVNGKTGAVSLTPADIGAVNLNGYVTSNTQGTDSGKWTKIASVTITSQYADAQAYINAIGYASGATSSRFKAFFRVKQQNPMGSAPLVELYLAGEGSRVTNNDLVAVTTVNTSSQTVVELYLRINNSYEQIAIQPEQMTSNNGVFVFYSAQGFIASLPSGTQTVATNDVYNSNASTASKLQTARTIFLTGDVSGSASFDGSANVSISATLSNKGQANGVASLDGNTKVPVSQLPSANTSTAGIVQLVDSVSNTSTTQAATANAVKQAYDKAIQAETNAKAYTDQQLAAHTAETASKFTNINLNIIDMAVELETLKGATLNGVTANIFIETFTNLNDINLMNGVYDSANKRLVL